MNARLTARNAEAFVAAVASASQRRNSFVARRLMERSMNRLIAFAALCFFYGTAIATPVPVTLSPTDISGFSVNTTQNGTGAAHNIAVLVVTGSQLTGGCQGIFIDSVADKSTYALILTAVSLRKTITLSYDPQIASPWGNPAWCGAINATIAP